MRFLDAPSVVAASVSSFAAVSTTVSIWAIWTSLKPTTVSVDRILEATDDVYEQTTAKGFDYEDLVDECVATLAAGYGDLAEVTAICEPLGAKPALARADALAARLGDAG